MGYDEGVEEMNTPYMYLFVREDLSKPQQIVQTAHAVDELNKKIPHPPGNFMVLCPADSEEELFKISEWLMHHEIRHSLFYEPDLESHTAIATEPLKGTTRKHLKKFQTMKL